MAISIGNVTLHMGPKSLGAPDDLEAAIVKFIDDAQKTLDVAVQELEQATIADALIRARNRGVKVRVVLEGDYLLNDKPSTKPYQATGKKEPNRELFLALLRANIDTRTDYNPNIFHQKFIVRDRDGGKRGLLTGSTNFTPTGVGKSMGGHGNNLNHLVEIKSARVLKQYALEFDEIWDGTFGAVRNRHETKPGEYTVSKVRVKPLFAPDHSPEMEIMKQMLKAKKRIDFAIFTFSQSSGIDDTMIALCKAGLPVRGIFDSGMARDWSGYPTVKKAGGDLYVARGAGLNKLHHKLMVIDGQVIIVGSFNYTGPANLLNDENIVIIGDLEETDTQAKANQRELAKYALKEINRMITKFGKKI
ncbi:MAG: phospholipase D-like domain-containing protein [Magnetovibrio sp.]|nr:phospholipase D-like domain-containing protein [Magnetovibrio sp.]